MATEQDITQLFERYLLGQCSAEEITQLYDYFGIDANHALLEDCIANTLTSTDDAPRAIVYRAQQIADRVGVRLREDVASNQVEPRLHILRWLPHVAAAIVAIIMIGWWAIGDRLSRIDEEQLPLSVDVVDIAPGSNRAKLTLADGRKIDLSQEQTGIVVGDEISYLDGTAVDPEAGNSGNWEEGGSGASKGGPRTNYYVLSTPKGGTYQIKLPDGSNVWLNAASTIRYPSRFSDEERVVFLEGEAYFEVSEQMNKEVRSGSNPHAIGRLEKIPFKVITNGQKIEVLGTEFNISAYPDEAEAKTTLVVGGVKVFNLKSKSSILLTPGQQATTMGSNTNIKRVNIDQYTAWKSGRFHFNRTPFNDMIRQIARWYDVEVVYRSEIPKETFSGKMGRELSLMEMLSLMDISDAMIRLEGRKLIVQ